MANEPEKYVEVRGDVIETVQRLLEGEDPTDKAEYEQLQTTTTLTESEQLWYDVLDLAIVDYKENLLAIHTPGKNIFSEVFDWFFNEHLNLTHLGSFENICLTLNINPSVIRKQLILWTQKTYNKESVEIPKLKEEIKQAASHLLYVNKTDVI